MRFMRIFGFLLFLLPVASFGATNEFMVAAQLLSAAKNADIQQVQALINDGANVNYVDSTGLSIVCTALMNNDVRAAQILQMYGADASKCDRQIKQYNSRNKPERSGGLFGGLSSAQSITLAAAGAAVIVGGLFLLTDVLNPGNSNKSSSSNGSHGGGNGGGNGGSSATVAFTLPYGPAMTDAKAENSDYATNLNFYSPSDENSSYYRNYTLMNNSAITQNYLLMMHGYSALARGYNGLQTLRYKDSAYSPVPRTVLNGYAVSGYTVEGGRPVNVALITANGINMHGKPAGEITAAVDSLDDRFVAWTALNGSSLVEPEYTNLSSKYYNNAITFGEDAANKVADATTAEDGTLVDFFDLSGNGTAVANTDATDYDNLLAKVVGGANSGFSGADYMGFMPYGQMTIFRTGGGVDSNGDPTDYYNYKALRNAATLYAAGDLTARSHPEIFANLDVIEPLHAFDAPTIETLLSTNPDMTNKTVYNVAFTGYVNSLYGDDDTTYQPGADSYYFFNNLGSAYLPLVLFSTGAVETDSSYSGEAKVATFENAAPLVYDNLEHLFASIVAVGQTGTAYTGNIASYTPSGKYVLMQWQNTNGTADDTTDDTYYRARMCGIAGSGLGDIDPWCFASVGMTDELAVASAAGAFGAMKSAFPYLNNKQIFALAALTADGAYLGTLDGKAATKDLLTSYLQGLYVLPDEYQAHVDGGDMTYLDAFKDVFGYGLINVERATTPGKSIHYYNGDSIVAASGNAYWRAATNTAFRSSSAFGARDATLKTSAYDVLTSVDGELSLPRVWTSEFSLGANSKHGLYMGDVLGELRTRDEADNRIQIGQMGFSMTTSQRAYADSMGGLDNMKLDWTSGNWNFAAGYQRHFTDGASRFTGLSNPILGLASNAVISDAKYNFGKWSFGARAFSGNVTDESLLENDPTIAANYEPARLGFVRGAGASVGWKNDRFAFDTTVGTANETNTVLGAYTNGLLGMGAGETVYVDNELRFRPTDSLTLTARATFARTTTDGAGGLVMGVSPLESNAFALGADWGNFRFSVAQPLAVRHGSLKYAYADYNVVDTDDGNFALNIADTHVAEIDLSADKRELRFSGEYRHNFGPFTDGALGFIYRVNPNNTDEFGNESIFMLKMTHRVGI